MRLSILLFLSLLASGCHAEQKSAAPVDGYVGMCDASAVVALNDDLFIVGDDEDSVLRIYSRAGRGRPVQQFNLSSFLGFKSSAEADLEGAARIGDHIFWITSHGNNRKGKEQESRQRFFAVKVDEKNAGITPIGTAYTRLLDDLLEHPPLRSLRLEEALKLPPKTPGALNIEGLAATPEGHLLIGFRNPVPQGRALLVPLLNPLDLLTGKPPRFGTPQFINLEGYGIRSIERFRDRYLIVAGSIDGEGPSRLYQWDGAGDPQLLRTGSLSGLNPEAISVIERGPGAELLVVSDDGNRKVNGVPCKQLKDADLKSFRAVALPLADLISQR
jgi:hypothetical protein